MKQINKQLWLRIFGYVDFQTLCRLQNCCKMFYLLLRNDSFLFKRKSIDFFQQLTLPRYTQNIRQFFIKFFQKSYTIYCDVNVKFSHFCYALICRFIKPNWIPKIGEINMFRFVGILHYGRYLDFDKTLKDQNIDEFSSFTITYKFGSYNLTKEEYPRFADMALDSITKTDFDGYCLRLKQDESILSVHVPQNHHLCYPLSLNNPYSQTIETINNKILLI